MLSCTGFAVLVAASLMATPASAQQVPDTRGMFVDAFVSPDRDDLADRYMVLLGTTWRSGITLGFDAGHSGFEFGVGVPQWHGQTQIYRYQYGGPSNDTFLQFHSYEELSTVRRRSVDVTANYRSNSPLNRHVTVSWVVGVGLVLRPEQDTRVTSEVLLGRQLAEMKTRSTTSSRDTRLRSRVSTPNFAWRAICRWCRGFASRYFRRSPTTADLRLTC
jgi:hypothetical protein